MEGAIPHGPTMDPLGDNQRHCSIFQGFSLLTFEQAPGPSTHLFQCHSYGSLPASHQGGGAGEHRHSRAPQAHTLLPKPQPAATDDPEENRLQFSTPESEQAPVGRHIGK